MSLWGDEFVIKETVKQSKKILNKIKTPTELDDKAIKKAVKTKKLSIQEKLKLIKEKVYKTLGKYVQDTIIIRTKQELINYID